MKKFLTDEIILLFLFAVIVIIVSKFFNVSIWQSATCILILLTVALSKILFSLSDQVKKLNEQNSRQYRITRIYDEKGEEVENRWTNEVEDGYWITIITDPIQNKIPFAEHTRTDQNINKHGRENCQKQEHSYNNNNVWGENYGGEKMGQKIIIAKK